MSSTANYCIICNELIDAGVATISMVGGQFPVDDPVFFVIDLTISPEVYAHRDCFRAGFMEVPSKSQER